MITPLPKLIWDHSECHRQLMRALDDAFQELGARDHFEEDWRQIRPFAGTKTSVCQTPMLGCGASGRSEGGFHLFAERYLESEGSDSAGLGERCSFERYQDFAFYSGGSWYDGKKVPLMAAECESNSAELLGELSGLMTIRCPLKYLFIHGVDVGRLKSFCAERDSLATDWSGTTYYVIEIPPTPSPPSAWTTHRAHVPETGSPIEFSLAD